MKKNNGRAVALLIVNRKMSVKKNGGVTWELHH